MASLRVGINWGMDTFSIANGQFRYAVELFASLAALNEDADFEVFGTRPSPPSEVAGLFTSPGTRWRWHGRPNWPWRWRYVADDAIDAVLFRRFKVDVLHCIDAAVPRFAPCPVLMTLYDLAPEVIEDPSWRETSPWRRYRRRAQELVARHVAISHATAADAARIWGIDPSRITVTPLGTRFPPRELADSPPGARLESLPVPRGPFLCSPYNLDPRKNIDALLVAMSQLRAEFPELRLVLFGRSGMSAEREAWFEATLDREGLRDVVVRIGFVTDLVLADLYRSSTIFVFPSLHEGFGLPLVEAMAVGACVVARNCSSMAEVVDHAGLLLETKDGHALSLGLARLLRDPDERGRLGRSAVAHAATYTLEREARLTFDAYRKAVRGA